MYYVYILKSLKTSKIYIGFTGDLRKRFVEHNSGQSLSTKYGMPWKLAYYEAYTSEQDAKIRENNLKDYGKALGQLKRRIANCLN